MPLTTSLFFFLFFFSIWVMKHANGSWWNIMSWYLFRVFTGNTWNIIHTDCHVSNIVFKMFNTLLSRMTTTVKHLSFCAFSWENQKTILSCKMLKALDTFGNCQRPVFSPGVSHRMNEITNLWKFRLNWSSKLQESSGRKTPLLHKFVFSDAWEKLQA